MTAPLDPAHDPDRYDPLRDAAGGSSAAVPASGPLDWAFDPDRYDPALDPDGPADAALPPARRAGRRSTLPDLLGSERSYQDSPSPYIWILGLLGILVFLLGFAFVFSHLGP